MVVGGKSIDVACYGPEGDAGYRSKNENDLAGEEVRFEVDDCEYGDQSGQVLN